MQIEDKNLADVIIAFVQTLFVAGTGVWAYFRFVRERSHSPRIKFDVSCTFHGPQAGAYLAAFRIVICNEGSIIQRLNNIRFRVRGISNEAMIQRWDAHPSRAAFPIGIVDDKDVIVSRKYGHVFVEPGVEQELSYVAPIGDEISYILVRAEFEYESRKRARTHSAERVFTVKAE